MKDGYLKVAAITPDTRVADTVYNTERICEKIRECSRAGAKVMVFPELCITGYSCGDLFLQDLLLDKAKEGLLQIAEETKNTDAIVFAGLPACETMPELVIAVEICEDLWSPNPPGMAHALSGATLIVNLSASDEATGKDIYRRDLVCGQSARL